MAVRTDRLQSPRQRKTIDRLARWLVRAHGTEPGWDALVLDVLSVGRDLRLQVREVRGDRTVRRPVDPGGLRSTPRRLARALQDDYADLVDGSWLSAALIVTVAERRWQRPGVELVLNYGDDPVLPAHAQHPVSAEDWRRHLARYRRMDRRIPDWLRERVAGAGLDVPER
ncbi:hypothetical protein AVL61_14290 [Kocuria rosea subsp. polaris]|uniref:Uncharacterized protein n=1 Tax=Kocuria rosea subsp. polaris TaxID=136273 RepID=A0A0W8IBI3_KOCRO|nr:hypothetical protein AVL61_14290 [Kocuria polaris]